ncbi:MAG: hypothetical protein M3Q47_03040 [Actinomycetota bacterium]|nr:hypothetical protein [Actinomycetota bacterium]
MVLATIHRHTATGRPFDVVHTHVEARRPGRAHGTGRCRPAGAGHPALGLHRNADFYATFDGGGRVSFAGVSAAQVA